MQPRYAYSMGPGCVRGSWAEPLDLAGDVCVMIVFVADRHGKNHS